MTEDQEPGEADEGTNTPSEPESDSDGLPAGIPDPESPPDFDADQHVLPPEDLVYPTFEFENGDISTTDGFALDEELDHEGMQSWLDSLANAVGTHDLAVEGADLRATLGIAPADVQVSFTPDEEQRGTLSVTFSFDAKVMRYEDADERPLGARGGQGFIPIEMLTTDRDPSDFRCYNWIEDPTPDGEDGG